MDLSSRYFVNKAAPTLKADSRKELLASLTRINLYNPPVQTCSTGWSFSGLYSGPTSIAYLFLRVSQIYPDLEFKGQSLLDWAQAYLQLSAYKRHPEVDLNHCGIANETLAQLSIKAFMERDHSLVQELCSYAKTINSTSVPGSHELLYGRAGYLYFLRLVRSAFSQFDQPNTYNLLNSTIENTVDRILVSQQPWTLHGKTYLGAAHGWIGIIAQILLSMPSSASKVEAILIELIKLQFLSGNFPSSLPAGSDKLVQFCHGGPGFVLAFNAIRPYYPNLQTDIDCAIEMARRDIWKRGLLTKTPSLCHGIAGNALALSDDAEFNHFLSCMASEALERQNWIDDAGKSDRFAGLYDGEAGRAWVWAVADKGIEKTCIGFNDL